MACSLIINADDFGLTPGINRAVAELYQAGVVSSASLMANGPAFEDAVRVVRQMRSHAGSSAGGLGVGCHLVLVDGVPVSHPESIPTLIGGDGKTFRSSLGEFWQAALAGRIEAADLAREMQAQIQRLQRAGIDVTHVDTHKHTHALPSVAKVLVHVADRCGVGPVRTPFEPAWSRAVSGASWLRRTQVALLGVNRRSFERVVHGLRVRGLGMDGTLGMAATGTLDDVTLRATLEAMRGRDGRWELCCHPGYQDVELGRQRTRLRGSRELEMRALLEVVPEMLAGADGPELIHFGSLGGGGHAARFGAVRAVYRV